MNALQDIKKLNIYIEKIKKFTEKKRDNDKDNQLIKTLENLLKSFKSNQKESKEKDNTNNSNQTFSNIEEFELFKENNFHSVFHIVFSLPKKLYIIQFITTIYSFFPEHFLTHFTDEESGKIINEITTSEFKQADWIVFAINFYVENDKLFDRIDTESYEKLIKVLFFKIILSKKYKDKNGIDFFLFSLIQTIIIKKIELISRHLIDAIMEVLILLFLNLLKDFGSKEKVEIIMKHSKTLSGVQPKFDIKKNDLILSESLYQNYQTDYQQIKFLIKVFDMYISDISKVKIKNDIIIESIYKVLFLLENNLKVLEEDDYGLKDTFKAFFKNKELHSFYLKVFNASFLKDNPNSQTYKSLDKYFYFSTELTFSQKQCYSNYLKDHAITWSDSLRKNSVSTYDYVNLLSQVKEKILCGIFLNFCDNFWSNEQDYNGLISPNKISLEFILRNFKKLLGSINKELIFDDFFSCLQTLIINKGEILNEEEWKIIFRIINYFFLDASSLLEDSQKSEIILNIIRQILILIDSPQTKAVFYDLDIFLLLKDIKKKNTICITLCFNIFFRLNKEEFDKQFEYFENWILLGKSFMEISNLLEITKNFIDSVPKNLDCELYLIKKNLNVNNELLHIKYEENDLDNTKIDKLTTDEYKKNKIEKFFAKNYSICIAKYIDEYNISEMHNLLSLFMDLITELIKNCSDETILKELLKKVCSIRNGEIEKIKVYIDFQYRLILRLFTELNNVFNSYKIKILIGEIFNDLNLTNELPLKILSKMKMTETNMIYVENKQEFNSKYANNTCLYSKRFPEDKTFDPGENSLFVYFDLINLYKKLMDLFLKNEKKNSILFLKCFSKLLRNLLIVNSALIKSLVIHLFSGENFIHYIEDEDTCSIVIEILANVNYNINFPKEYYFGLKPQQNDIHFKNEDFTGNFKFFIIENLISTLEIFLKKVVCMIENKQNEAVKGTFTKFNVIYGSIKIIMNLLAFYLNSFLDDYSLINNKDITLIRNENVSKLLVTILNIFKDNIRAFSYHYSCQLLISEFFFYTKEVFTAFTTSNYVLTVKILKLFRDILQERVKQKMHQMSLTPNLPVVKPTFDIKELLTVLDKIFFNNSFDITLINCLEIFPPLPDFFKITSEIFTCVSSLKEGGDWRKKILQKIMRFVVEENLTQRDNLNHTILFKELKDSYTRDYFNGPHVFYVFMRKDCLLFAINYGSKGIKFIIMDEIVNLEFFLRGRYSIFNKEYDDLTQMKIIEEKMFHPKRSLSSSKKDKINLALDKKPTTLMEDINFLNLAEESFFDFQKRGGSPKKEEKKRKNVFLLNNKYYSSFSHLKLRNQIKNNKPPVKYLPYILLLELEQLRSKRKDKDAGQFKQIFPLLNENLPDKTIEYNNNMLNSFIKLEENYLKMEYKILILFSPDSNCGLTDDILLAPNQTNFSKRFLSFISSLGNLYKNTSDSSYSLFYKDSIYNLKFQIMNKEEKTEKIKNDVTDSKVCIIFIDNNKQNCKGYKEMLTQRNGALILYFVIPISDSHFLIKRKYNKNFSNKHIKRLSKCFINNYIINIKSYSSVKFFITHLIKLSEWCLYIEEKDGYKQKSKKNKVDNNPNTNEEYSISNLSAEFLFFKKIRNRYFTINEIQNHYMSFKTNGKITLN